MSEHKDIVIIGGGASGIVCAIKAAEINKNKRITILEKQPKIGRKLLSTGNGRCNFTNISSDVGNYHGSFAKYVDKVFENYSPERIINIFKGYGLVSKVEAEGRVYPYSNHASSVVDVLRYKLESLNVEIICDCEVENVIKNKADFLIKTKDATYSAEKVVFTTGSMAGNKLGGSMKGINILQELGHSTSHISPALCPIIVKNNVLPSIKGLRSTGKVSLICNNKIIKEETGEIQFTENALSGICVFNLATYVKDNNNYLIKVSLLPEFSDEKLKEMMKKRINTFRNRPCEDLFTGLFHKKLGIALLKECNIKPISKHIKELTANEIEKITNIINNWNFSVTGLADYSKAQVVSGGIKGKEINPNTMESKLIPNLYICGEAIDIDGDCGGYNLQFAFASGFLAGENL